MSNSIIELSELSVRAKNVCKNYDFITAEDINDYMLSGRDIYRLQNCGKKTAQEILTFANKSSESYESLINQYEIIIEYDFKEEIFNLIFSHELSQLSVRARNGYHLIADNDENSIRTFIEKTIFNNTSFKSFKNIGLKASYELNNFRVIIQKLIIKFSDKNLEREDFFIIKLEYILKINFKNDFRLLLKNNKVDLIHFFDEYVLESSLFSRRIYKSLIINYLNPDNKNYSSIKKIAEDLDLTKERIRQLKLNLKEIDFKVFSEILMYSDFFINNISNYPYTKVFDIVPTFQKKLNYLNANSTTLTKIIDLISINHSVFFEGEKLNAINKGHNVFNREYYTKIKALKTNYLFSKSFINKEVCLLIINDVFKKNCAKTEEDYFYNPFKNYNFNSKQEDFVKKLVFENINISFHENGFLIQRNTIITVDEIIKEILIKANEPLLISEIYERLNRSNPGRCKNENAVRTAITRDKDKFIYLRGATKEGLTLYGLAEWENTKNLKGGTIKQLCIDYIKSKNEPVHILELTRYISKFRDVNQHSLHSNLKAGEKNRFVYFKSNYIGLKEINYDKSKILTLKTLGGNKSKNIGEFIKNNIYYNYEAVVRKFAKDLNCYPIQIEQSILNYINNGVIKLKGDKIYYNSIQEDSIIKNLFNSVNEVEIAGYNPYMINLNGLKIIIRVKQTSNASILLKEEYFDFSGFYNRNYFSENKCLLIHNPYNQFYKAFLWEKEFDIKIIDLKNNFQMNKDFEVSNIDKNFNIVEFSKEKTNKFLSFLNILVESNMKNDSLKINGNSIELNYLNVKNISQLKAIELITKEALEKYKIELEIKEAREIYQRILLSKN